MSAVATADVRPYVQGVPGLPNARDFCGLCAFDEEEAGSKRV
jgi:hypothetical protein